ncbi:hypothetical protein D3C73_1588240 [compost metagenome]
MGDAQRIQVFGADTSGQYRAFFIDVKAGAMHHETDATHWQESGRRAVFVGGRFEGFRD